MLEKNIWLKIKGKYRYSAKVNSIGAISAHASKPTCDRDEIAIQIQLAIPNSLFDDPSYTARIELPETERELPPMAVIGDNVEKALSAAMGFKIKVEMGDDAETDYGSSAEDIAGD